MKQLFVMSALAIAAIGGAQAPVLFNNGAAVSGMPPLSVVRAGGTALGFGAQSTLNNLVGDDFSVAGANWNVASFSFFAYQSNATAFGFTAATWSVISGDVNTGTVVASGATSATSGGLLG